MEEQPSYYAIIPAEIRYCDKLAPNEKLLYGEITSLCNKTGQCYATNQYFAELYNVSSETISRWVSHLIKNDFITSEIDKEKGNKRYIQLNQYLLTKKSIPIDKKINTPIDKKINNNNTSNNNIFNNKYNKEKEEKEKTIDDLLKLQPIELQSNLKEFLKMRKAIKKPMTTRAFELLLKDLDKLANDNETKNKILEQSILHSWQGVFELKNNNKPKQQEQIEEKPDLTKRRFDTDGVELFYVEGKWYRLDSQMFKFGLTCLEDGRCIQNGKLL